MTRHFLSPTLLRAHAPSLGRLFGFHKDETGVAAAEFSIIAPMVIGLYLGLAEMSFAMAKERQIAHSASVAGDMVAQETDVDTDDMADVIAATLRVSQIGDLKNYAIQISSWERVPDSSGSGSTVEPLGSAIFNPNGADMLAEVDPESFADQILSEASGVVVANVAYSYSPLGFNKVNGKKGEKFLDPQIIMRETFMLKPRRSSTVVIGSGGSSEMTCSGTGQETSCVESGGANNTAGGES